MPGLLISAAHKSSGKTTVSLGICAALSARGLCVQPFKKGPDYIDPIWLSRAAGRACVNLDFYTSTTKEIEAAYTGYGLAADISVVEGNKGLFDGLDLDGCNSNAALAKLLNLPVVLVIDAQGITRGVAPLLQGYVGFDSGVDIQGVILNRVAGPRHESKLLETIKHYTELKVLGVVRRFKITGINERHLGLVPANEDKLADQKIAQLRQIIQDSVDLDGLVKLSSGQVEKVGDALSVTTRPSTPNLKIGIAKDAAFGFYYPDDLDEFRRVGAELVPFDTLHDRELPEDIDGLFLGGGFPETQMHSLAENKSMLRSIYVAIEQSLPSYAECGGLMYLSRGIEWDGNTAKMVGVIPAQTIISSRPQGRGYIQLQNSAYSPWPRPDTKAVINAHEFHYSRLEGLPDSTRFAYKVLRGEGIRNQQDGIVYKNLLASYAHLRDSSQNPWVSRFVDFVRQCK
jgi:cobyrinic acid a,c-diamide synthase